MAKRDSIESIAKQELFERIYHWLENGENEIDNSLYKEESDDDLSSGSVCDFEATTRHNILHIENIHPIKTQEKYLQGCSRTKTEPHEFIRIYQSNIWMPQATLV